jgi:hypothetical protein
MFLSPRLEEVPQGILDPGTGPILVEVTGKVFQIQV